jgi:hypothetical protein
MLPCSWEGIPDADAAAASEKVAPAGALPTKN